MRTSTPSILPELLNRSLGGGFKDFYFHPDPWRNDAEDHVWILPGQYPFIFKYSSGNDGLMWVSNIALAVFRLSQDGNTLEFRLSSKKSVLI